MLAFPLESYLGWQCRFWVCSWFPPVVFSHTLSPARESFLHAQIFVMHLTVYLRRIKTDDDVSCVYWSEHVVNYGNEASQNVSFTMPLVNPCHRLSVSHQQNVTNVLWWITTWRDMTQWWDSVTKQHDAMCVRGCGGGGQYPVNKVLCSSLEAVNLEAAGHSLVGAHDGFAVVPPAVH